MPWRRLVLVSLAVFLTRAPFVPPALEDYDSVNFALALEDFDPLAHQPHPPGYPVYVALARAVFTAVPEPSLALGVLSALAQALAVFPAFAVFSSLDRRLAWPASLLLFTCPAVWFNGARPLSDSVGLLFTLGAQALLLRHLEAGRGLAAGSLLAGIGLGVRLQSLLLTAPLWLLAVYRRGPRLKATAAGILGVALWLVPLLVLSGGPSRYLTAFGETMGLALDIEPLFTRFSLNLAARAAGFVLIGPWVAPALGALMLGLALIGTWPMALRQQRGLALALLCFGPYLLAHAAFHQVEAVRYALPYVPLLCLLSAAGIAWLVGLTRVRRAARLELGLAALLGAGAAMLTLPALWVYAAVASPPEAAVDAVRAVAAGRPRSRAAGPGLFRRGGVGPRARGPRKHASPTVPGFLLASHYTLQRYTADLPEDLEVLASGPTDTVPRLIRYWLDGGRKDTLFLADARRTDLASIDPRAQRLLGRWEWPLHADRFMPGARPTRTELVEIAPPGWATGPGWLLSLEAGRPEEMGVLPERLAYLRSLDEPAFLLLAGEPAGEPAGCTLDLDLDGEPLDSMPCGGPFLRALTLPPRANGGYATLRLRSHGPDGSTPSSVLLRGLDYGPRRRTGWVHGPGWHYPERDEQGRLFRWTSARARSLVHVPEGGAWLRIEGTAPVGYVGTGGLVSLRVDGSELARSAVGATGFTLEVRLPDTPEADREVTLESERSFVPDEFQRNGDLRELGVRIYRFELRRRGFGSQSLPVPAGADETSEARR